MNLLNTFCEQNEESLIIRERGTYSYHCAIKLKIGYDRVHFH
jgi:hypothetical protein